MSYNVNLRFSDHTDAQEFKDEMKTKFAIPRDLPKYRVVPGTTESGNSVFVESSLFKRKKDEKEFNYFWNGAVPRIASKMGYTEPKYGLEYYVKWWYKNIFYSACAPGDCHWKIEDMIEDSFKFGDTEANKEWKEIKSHNIFESYKKIYNEALPTAAERKEIMNKRQNMSFEELCNEFNLDPIFTDNGMEIEHKTASWYAPKIKLVFTKYAILYYKFSQHTSQDGWNDDMSSQVNPDEAARMLGIPKYVIEKLWAFTRREGLYESSTLLPLYHPTEEIEEIVEAVKDEYEAETNYRYNPALYHFEGGDVYIVFTTLDYRKSQELLAPICDSLTGKFDVELTASTCKYGGCIIVTPKKPDPYEDYFYEIYNGPSEVKE